MSDTDVLVILNADIQIDDPEFLEKIAGPVISGDADLTSCPIKEKEPATFLEKAVYTSMRVKTEVFEGYNKGNNVYTCHGTARALSKRFYKGLEFKEGPGEDAHSYFSCIKSGYEYKYIKDTFIKYRLSDNFTDYQKQNLRFIKSKELMFERFGKDYAGKKYKLPILLVITTVIKFAIKAPVSSFSYLIIYLFSYFGYVPNSVPKNWESSKSSKVVRDGNQLSEEAKEHDLLRKAVYSFTHSASSLLGEKYDGIILCYHSIGDDSWEFSVSLEKFKQQIGYMLKTHEPINLEEFKKYLNGEKKPDKPFFIVTFDDGYKNITKTKDYLKENGVEPILFVLSEPEKVDRYELENELELLSESDVKELEISGWEIGCHSATHSDLVKVSPKELKREVSGAKKRLGEKLGFVVKYFAYPKGRYNNEVKTIVKEAGYDLSFSMDNKVLDKDADKYAIPRVGVMGTHSFEEFKSMIRPFSTKVRGILSSEGY
jgi:peptidoglycan/xylan/chitin deacetylase (PgdA/CDA1 family)